MLLTVLILVSWYKRAPKGQRKRIANRALIIGGAAILLLLIFTGRLNPLFALVAALVPLVYRAISLLQLAQGVKGAANAFRGARGPSPGQTSDVETRFLRMTLNHDTGEMDGEILEGPHRGKRLSAVALDDLLGLLDECRREDAQSAAVLEAFLDRRFGEEWRGDTGADDSRDKGVPGDSRMNSEEARSILGVGKDASREEIVAAHRQLIQKLHPDRGGTAYLAAKLNEAKRVLLEALGSDRTR